MSQNLKFCICWQLCSKHLYACHQYLKTVFDFSFLALVAYLLNQNSHCAQYKKFVEEVCPQHKSQFLDSSNRVDQLYHGLLAGNDAYGQLWSVVKMVLLLSHGQAIVERGFSVNRQVDDDNLHADTFCCRRLICDTVGYFGDIYAIDTTYKELLLSCSSAWHKYQLDLEQNKKNCHEGHNDPKKKGCGWQNSESEE